MNCRALLEPDAAACVECGVKTGEAGPQSGTAAVTATGATVASGRNTLSFQEDKNNRRFDASLTDEAMQALGSVFGDLFAHRGTVRLPPRIAGTQTKQAATIQGVTLAIPAAVETPAVSNAEPTPPPTPASTDGHPSKTDLATFFAENGDNLELIDNRLKASSQADYTRQLTYLFLYAHEAHGRMSVPERDLNTLLNAAKVMDANGNTRSWLRKRVGIVDEGDSNVKLNAGGRDGAKKALRDALDVNLPVTWSPDAISTKPKSSKAKTAKGKSKS
jgi:hypothetical protein